MARPKDGYIKFNCEWINDKLSIPNDIINDLVTHRNQLYKKHLIGIENNIGFGNVSCRYKDKFIITGSATGGLNELSQNDLSLVESYNIDNNSLICRGNKKASSESLSHAIIYETFPWVNSVVHIHHYNLWKALLEKYPTTGYDTEYGTPEMAYSIKKCLIDNPLNIIVMGGHESGIISYGNSVSVATKLILNIYNNYVFDSKI